MSAGQGRPAALPAMRYRVPGSQDQLADNPFRVLCRPECGGTVEFDLSGLPTSDALRAWFIEGLSAATGPSGSARTVDSARSLFRAVRSFAAYVGSLEHPPDTPHHLRGIHWDGWTLTISVGSRRTVVGSMRSMLRYMPEVPDEFFARSLRNRRDGHAKVALPSYTEAQFTQITAAAKAEVRACARRMRAGRALLSAWRGGEIDQEADRQRWEHGQLLDHLERHKQVPRHPCGSKHRKVFDHGGSLLLFSQLYPTCMDMAAATVLLICLTGHNLSSVLSLRADPHRPDGDAGGPKTALVEMIKPRRGSRAYMNVAFTGTDIASGVEDANRVDLSTSFAVYELLCELSEPVRSGSASDLLLGYFTTKAGPRFQPAMDRGAIGRWSRSKKLFTPADKEGDEPVPLLIDTRRLRMTWLQLHQKPVGHTEITLANDYLARDRGNLAEYQQIVAKTLDEQVSAARQHALMQTLTVEQVERACTDPETVAKQVGVTPETLDELLSGKRDTVMAGCVDHTNGPYSSAGQACTASFLLCLSCPCARATPAHLPVIAAVHDRLHAIALEMAPLRWTQRFAGPATQLSDIMGRYSSAQLADARGNLTEAHRELVDRFLSRSLDLS